MYFSEGLAPSQPYFHLPLWYWHWMPPVVRASRSPVGAATALATVAATRKRLVNCMFADGGMGLEEGVAWFAWSWELNELSVMKR